MARSKSVVKQNSMVNSNTMVILVGIAFAAFVIYYLIKKPPVAAAALPAGTYNNAETWEILWSKDGLPTKVIVHREAVRQ